MVRLNLKYGNVACGIFFMLAALSVICIRFVALSNNLIFSDEGWYLCLLRDLPHHGVTRFHLLFQNAFNNDIYTIRVACLILQIVASAFMSFGMALWAHGYYPSIKTWCLFILLFCALSLMQGVEECPSFNYINLNKVCVEFSVGFLFIGLAKQKSWYFLAVGFLISFLLPIMITNVALIPAILVVILLLSKNRKRDALLFCCGILLFVVYYILFVESPKEIIAFIVSETESMVGRGGSEYGAGFMLTWLKQTILYLTKLFVIAVLLYGVYWSLLVRKIVRCNKNTAIVFFGIIASVLLFYLWKYLPPDLPRGSIGDLLWIVLFFMLLVSYIGNEELKFDEFVLTAFLALTPVMLSFGSIVPFNIRGQAYFVFIIPLVVFYSIKNGKKWRTLLMSLLVFSYVMFLISLSRANWHGEKVFDNQVPVKTIGIEQNVKLSERYIEELNECRNRIPKGKILCDFENWGVVSLLDYTPVSYEYDVSRNTDIVFKRIVDDSMKGEKGLWAIARKWDKPFLNKLNSIEGYEVRMDSVKSNDNYYIYITNSQSIEDVN